MSEIGQIRTVLSLIKHHERLKHRSISLVPTENRLSPLAMIALASDLVNRYYLLDSTVWEYPQTDDIGSISDIAVDALARLYECRYVNIRPLSGLSCMTIVLASLTSPGETLYSLAPSDGGHGATRVVAERLGLRSRHLALDGNDLQVDASLCSEAFEREPPNFVYIDHANMLVPIDVTPLLAMMPRGAFLYYDCSHIMGLMADKSFFQPTQYGLPLIGGSLHKTFPGPQKGALLTNDEGLATRLEITSNSFVSSHHVNSIAALAIGALEMLEFGADYSRQLRRNALTLGKALLDEGLPVQFAGAQITTTHQVWVQAPSEFADPSAAVRALKGCDLVVNCARLPTLQGKKGLRFGATEVTRVGMREGEMATIARLVADCLLDRRPADAIGADVNALSAEFVQTQYCHNRVSES